MAFRVLTLEDGRKQITCTNNDRVAHIITRADGTYWIEEEDVIGPIYEDYRSVLLAARALCQDPDL